MAEKPEEDPLETCAICFKMCTNPFRLECRHTFCNDCITGWCKVNDAKGEETPCPQCRRIIIKKPHYTSSSVPELQVAIRNEQRFNINYLPRIYPEQQLLFTLYSFFSWIREINGYWRIPNRYRNHIVEVLQNVNNNYLYRYLREPPRRLNSFSNTITSSSSAYRQIEVNQNTLRESINERDESSPSSGNERDERDVTDRRNERDEGDTTNEREERGEIDEKETQKMK